MIPANETASAQDAPKQLKIALVCAESMADGYAPFSHVNGIAKGLRTLGHDVTVIGMDSGPYHKVSFPSRLMRYLKVNWRAMRATSDVDVMIARGHFAHLPWTMLAKKRNIPVVHEMNGTVFDAATTHGWLRPLQAIVSGSYDWQFAHAAGVACVTKEIAQNVRQMGHSVPIEVISNGVDPDVFFPGYLDFPGQVAFDWKGRPDGPFVLFSSSLTKWHGVSTILAALDHPSWPAGVKLVVVGDGTNADAVKEWAARDNRLLYMGIVTQSELASIMRKASVGLCLIEGVSHRKISEVYPLKLFEMLASGLPVVVTDLPGQRDILKNNGAGLLVQESSPGSLARAIADILADPQFRDLGLSASATIRDEYSWTARAREMGCFLKAILPPGSEERGR